MTRREFLGAVGRPAALGAVAAALDPLGVRAALAMAADYAKSPAEAAADEPFWFEIQQAFTVDRSVINLNNGGVSPSPAVVQAADKRHLDFSNSTPPPVALWQVLEPQRETVRQRLARTFSADAEEIALVRNAPRLRHLRDRWALRLADQERVRLHTSLKPGKSCGIASVEIVGLDPRKLADHLWQRRDILATPIVHPEFRGLRVTPSVYTTLGEIDQFSEVMVEIAEKGLPV